MLALLLVSLLPNPLLLRLQMVPLLVQLLRHSAAASWRLNRAQLL